MQGKHSHSCIAKSSVIQQNSSYCWTNASTAKQVKQAYYKLFNFVKNIHVIDLYTLKQLLRCIKMILCCLLRHHQDIHFQLLLLILQKSHILIVLLVPNRELLRQNNTAKDSHEVGRMVLGQEVNKKHKPKCIQWWCKLKHDLSYLIIFPKNLQ